MSDPGARAVPARPPLTADDYRRLAHGVFLLTAYGSLIPLRYRPVPFDEALAAFRAMPLAEPWRMDARGDWVVSILQYAALGFLFMGALAVDRRRWVGWAAAMVVLPMCLASAVVLEFLQIYFPPRTVSLNDLGVEAIGGLTGTLAWLAAGRRVTGWARALPAAAGLPGLAARLLPGYLVALAVAAMMPFDLTLGRAELARKFAEGRVVLVPFGPRPGGSTMTAPELLANGAGFLPVGLLWGLAAGRTPRRGPAVLAAAVGVAGGVEALQLFVYSRHFDAGDIVTGAAAVLLGWWLGRACHAGWAGWIAARGDAEAGPAGPTPWRPAAWAAAALAYLAGLVAFNWQPFDFTLGAGAAADDPAAPLAKLGRMSWFPLVDYYAGSKYQAFDQFVVKGGSFLPLGVLAAIYLRRVEAPGASLPVAFVALLLGAAVEAGQVFLPGRHPSVTDLTIECVGAWLGFVLTRYAWSVIRAGAAPGPSGSPRAVAQGRGRGEGRGVA